MHSRGPAQWQLPRGVSRGVWEYTQSDHIADLYDEFFADNRLFEFDEQILARHFTRPGLVADLGAGTGRALVGLARRGFAGLAIDLSLPMLRIVAEKARLENLPIHRLRANLVELNCLRDGSIDYALCLFSTLGMVRKRANRQRLLAHVRRILKPDGLFVLHVHNLWYNLFDPQGRRWLVRHLLCVGFQPEIERGDKYFPYRGIPRMFLHVFTRGELVAALRSAGFKIKEIIPLDAPRQRRLRCPRLLGRIRANGWVVVCQ